MKRHLVSLSQVQAAACVRGNGCAGQGEKLAEAAALLMETIAALDCGGDVDMNKILSKILQLPYLAGDLGLLVADASLRATNFVQKWFTALVRKGMPEKHAIRITENLYFNTDVSRRTMDSIIAFARGKLDSGNGEVSLKAHCILESNGCAGKRDGGTALFVSYVFAENASEFLIYWSNVVKDVRSSVSGECASDEDPYLCEDLGLERLFLPKITVLEFFVRELKYMGEFDVVETVILNLGSQKVLHELFLHIFCRLRHRPTRLRDLIVQTFRPSDFKYTRKIFERLLQLDPHIGEHVLKSTILGTQWPGFFGLFCEMCHRVDSAYAELFLMFKEHIDHTDMRLVPILRSHYLPFLMEDNVIFETLFPHFEREGHSLGDVFHDVFRFTRELDLNVLERLLFLCRNFVSLGAHVSGFLKRALENLAVHEGTGSLYVRNAEGLQLRLPFTEKARSALFCAISILREYSLAPLFCEMLAKIDEDRLIELIFATPAADTPDALFVLTLNEAHKCRLGHPGFYEKLCERLLKMHALYESSYWHSIVRKNISIRLDHLLAEEQCTTEFEGRENICRMSTEETLLSRLLACTNPTTCKMLENALDEREQFSEGVAMHNSCIAVKNIKSGRFCVYGVFSQIGRSSRCILVSLIFSPFERLCFCAANSRYFTEFHTGKKCASIFLALQER